MGQTLKFARLLSNVLRYLYKKPTNNYFDFKHKCYMLSGIVISS